MSAAGQDRSIAVVGAGLIGSGVAQVAAVAGYEVVLHDVETGALEQGVAAIRSSLYRFVEKGRVTTAEAAAARDRVRTTTDLGDCAAAAFVLEAVPEDLTLKRVVFEQLDEIARVDAVFATTTSSLSITRLATAVREPGRVVGTHFFSPVPTSALCEVVRGLQTSDLAVERARELVVALGKTPVAVERDVTGFLAARLSTVLALEAVRLVESGVATAADIDAACRLGLGHARGPLETVDALGVDAFANAARALHDETGQERYWPSDLVSRMVEAGRLGRSTGEGFHRYG